jgi:hypothetical protein
MYGVDGGCGAGKGEMHACIRLDLVYLPTLPTLCKFMHDLDLSSEMCRSAMYHISRPLFLLQTWLVVMNRKSETPKTCVWARSDSTNCEGRLVSGETWFIIIMLVILYMNQCSIRVQYKTPMQMQTIPRICLYAQRRERNFVHPIKMKTPKKTPSRYTYLPSSRRPNSPIAPWTSMSARAQQRPRLIQRIAPLSPDGNALARRTPRAHRTSASRSICRRRRTTHTRRRSDTDSRRPSAHPPTDPAPVQMAALEFAVVVNRDDDLFVARVRAASARLVVTEVHKLQPNCGVHDEHAGCAEEEGRGAQDPTCSVAAFWSYPAVALARRVVVPCTGVGEERGRVEEVAEEGGCEENGGEASCRLSDLVFVQLGQAGAEVEKRAHPGEDFACNF